MVADPQSVWGIPTFDPAAPPPPPNFGSPDMTVTPLPPSQMPVNVPYPDNAGVQSMLEPVPAGPVSAWAAPMVQSAPQQPSQQAINPALQTAQQGAQQPIFNPYQTGGKLAAWGVPPDAVAQALRELGLA